MSLRKSVLDELETLDEQQLARVSEYVSLLKSRPPEPDDSQLAAGYAEAANEDQASAEVGVGDYHHGLTREDDEAR